MSISVSTSIQFTSEGPRSATPSTTITTERGRQRKLTPPPRYISEFTTTLDRSDLKTTTMTRDVVVPFSFPVRMRNSRPPVEKLGEWKDWRLWRAPYGKGVQDEFSKDFWKNWTPYVERVNSEREYKLVLHFAPLFAQVTRVSCKDGVLTVSGRAGMAAGGDPLPDEEYVEREFTRQFNLPEECDPFRLSATLDDDLILTICCPKANFPLKTSYIPIPRTRRNVSWIDHLGKAVAA